MTIKTDTKTKTMRNMIIGAVAVVVLAAIGGVVFFFSGSAPEEATLEDAVAVAQQEQAPDTTAAPSTTQAAAPETQATAAPEDPAEQPGAGAVDGTWTVDTSVGEFSFADATSSFVGFRVGEELANIGRTEAVGRTPAVSGTIELQGSTLVGAVIEADFTQITTDRERRNGAVQRALETSEFPTATFQLASPVELGSVPADGESISVTVAGDLTVHGVTQPIEFPLEAQVVGDLIVIVGQFEIEFADFGVSVPSAPAVLSANDFGTVEVQLFFSR